MELITIGHGSHDIIVVVALGGTSQGSRSSPRFSS
jgi:hypothetical protein